MRGAKATAVPQEGNTRQQLTKRLNFLLNIGRSAQATWKMHIRESVATREAAAG
ncbi:MAG: hypothetical protein RLZZ436_98 [Planctomycetota bacterium]|jgi:hypothetical protein